MGSGCLCHTDSRFRRIPKLLHYSLVELTIKVPYLNASGDTGRQGLHDLKLRFQPVEMCSRNGARMILSYVISTIWLIVSDNHLKPRRHMARSILSPA